MLSRQLALHSPELAVLPEFRLLDLLFVEGEQNINLKTPNELYEFMLSDYMIDSLGLCPPQLQRIAEECQGKGIRYLIEKIVISCASLQGKNPVAVLIQLGGIRYIKQLLLHFPDSVLIHIFRDARGVVSSMIRTERPYFPGEKMGRDDVVYAAEYWNNFLRNIDKIRQRKSVMDVRYEDFCRSLNQSVKKIIEALDLHYVQSGPIEKKFSFQVGERERGIHPLIEKDPVLQRLEAWKEELTHLQGTAIEVIAEEMLLKKGYNRWFTSDNRPWKKTFFMCLAYADHWLKTIQHCTRKIVQYAKYKSRFSKRVKAFIVNKSL